MAAQRLPLLSGLKKAPAVIDEYLQCALKNEYEGISGEDTSRQWSELQKKSRELLEHSDIRDIAAIAESDAAHADWKEAHIKVAKAQLHRIIEEMEIIGKARKKLNASREHLKSRLSEVDHQAAAIKDDNVDKIVDNIMRMCLDVPRVGVRVGEELERQLPDSFDAQCDQIRNEIAEIKQSIKDDIVRDLWQVINEPHNWQELQRTFKMADAPEVAFKEVGNLQELQDRVDAAEQELADTQTRLRSEIAAKEAAEAELTTSKAGRQQDAIAAADELKRTEERFAKEFEQKFKEAQPLHEAADSFLKHLSTSLGSSTFPALGAEDLKTLHANCKQPKESADASLWLPPIVIAAGYLPGAWSYLCLASGGVMMNNRFNSIIRSSVSYELPWILDALDRVIKMAESAPVVPADVLLVLLQGIAFVHLAMRSTTVELTPKPLDLLHSLMKHANSAGSVLEVVWTRVLGLVDHGEPVNTWILNDERNTGKQINSSNSALPEGTSLVYGLGFLFLTRSATDPEQLFVIDKQAVQCVWRLVTYAYLQLPSVEGLEIRQLDIITEDEHIDVADWLRGAGLVV